MPHRKRLKVNRHSVSLECLMRQLFLLALLIAVTRTSSLDGSDHHGGKVAGEQQEERKWYQKAVSDAGVKMGQIDLDDLDDLPLKGLSDTQALGLLFQRLELIVRCSIYPMKKIIKETLIIHLVFPQAMGS